MPLPADEAEAAELKRILTFQEAMRALGLEYNTHYRLKSCSMLDRPDTWHIHWLGVSSREQVEQGKALLEAIIYPR